MSISARVHSEAGVFNGIPEIVIDAFEIGKIMFQLNIKHRKLVTVCFATTKETRKWRGATSGCCTCRYWKAKQGHMRWVGSWNKAIVVFINLENAVYLIDCSHGVRRRVAELIYRVC